MKINKITVIVILFIASMVLVACERKEISEINDFKNVFTGIWEYNDSQEQMYYKFREDRIEYQSSKERYMTSDIIENIKIDDKNKIITISYISDGDNDTEESILKIKVNSEKTITIDENIELKKNNDIESIALNLKDTYKVNIEGDKIYSDGLNEFLEISQSDLLKIFDTKEFEQNKKEVHTTEEARAKAIEILEANNYIDSSIKGTDVYYIDEAINNNNKKCYLFGIATEESEFDFRILIEKETLDAIFMYSDGAFEEIKPLEFGEEEVGTPEDGYESQVNFIEPLDVNTTQKEYIESRLTKDKAIDLVISLPFYKEGTSTYPLVLDEEISMISVGDKLGYLMTVRSYGDVVDSRMEDIFLDIDTGNIYRHDYFDTTYIDLNEVIHKIN